jgi:hypothetical protein
LLRQRARWRRNVVKICVSKHRDQFVLGRYGFANAVLAVAQLLYRLLIPLVLLVGLFWTAAENGPLSTPEVLVTLYWILLIYLLIRMLIVRDLATTPMPMNFWLIFVYPFYLLLLVGPAQFYAELTELFRIGAKHPYVPDHIWEEIPWW